MRLSNLVPSLPAPLVASLEANGIRTEVDLLFSASTFDIFRRLPAGTVTLQELINYTSVAAELCAAPGVSAYEVFSQEEAARSNEVELQSGNSELDALLQGLGGRKVIELSGDKGSGKSVLALNLLLHHLKSCSGSNAIWIDTTGEFSPERTSDILDTKQIPTSVLQRFQVSLAFDIGAVQTLLEDLHQLNDPHLRFLVLDCITPLLGPLLSAVSAQGHAIMTDFMRQLQTFAQNLGATVIVINNTASTGIGSSDRKPALGPSFILMTDTTLWLQRNQNVEDDDSLVHSISVLKSRSIPTCDPVPFRISNNALYPA